MKELFRLQDLKKNGVLEEGELIKLNEKIAMLHYGKEVDRDEIKERYRTLFRERLHPEGKPVTYARYREYLTEVLADIDRNLQAQEMILEQWVAEADSARAAFFYPSLQSISDEEFLQNLSFNAEMFGSGPGRGFLPPTSTQNQSPPGSLKVSSSKLGSLHGAAPVHTSVGSDFPAPRDPPESSLGFGSVTLSEQRQPPPPPPFDGSLELRVSMDSALTFRPGSYSSMRSSVGPPEGTQASMLSMSSMTGVSGFTVGQRIQVWSGSKQAWLGGSVLEVFHTDTKAEGFAVPAGTVKVTSAAGVKWVLPADVPTTLQPEGLEEASYSLAPLFAEGDLVEVWSGTHGMWLEGAVLQAFTVATVADGFSVPAGTLKVRSPAGVKWVLPEKAGSVLRAAGSRSSGSRRQTSAATTDFVKGAKVQVWSSSRQAWMDATVAEVFETAGTADGFAVPAGAMKVVSDAGTKWLKPDDIGKLLRKPPMTVAELEGAEPAGAELEREDTIASAAPGVKERVEAMLNDDDRLLMHVRSVWMALGCGQGSDARLAKRSTPAALEAFACQFGLHLDLEGQHFEAVLQKSDAFDGDGDGYLSMLELRDMTRALTMELYAML